MTISQDFPGGNASVISQDDNEVVFDCDTREDDGTWFYWAFCVTGAAGRTIRFRIPHRDRVGRFGAAVSDRLADWRWSGSRDTCPDGEGFTYTFAPSEDRVYFAHSFIYSDAMLRDFAARHDIRIDTLCRSRKGRAVPCFSIGRGEDVILFTSRHHSCESSGTYVLQGVAEACQQAPTPGIRFVFVPFVDYDGVQDGDQGKARRPHDHNRDYIAGAASIYPEVAELRNLADSGQVLANVDLHAPWHEGKEHDQTYFLRGPDDADGRIPRVYTRLAERTAADRDSFRYTGGWDFPYGVKWNETDVPTMRNYFLPRTRWRASFTLETSYFGLSENPFTAARVVALGRHLHEALLVLKTGGTPGTVPRRQ